jgi:hypothetical protein
VLNAVSSDWLAFSHLDFLLLDLVELGVYVLSRLELVSAREAPPDHLYDEEDDQYAFEEAHDDHADKEVLDEDGQVVAEEVREIAEED